MAAEPDLVMVITLEVRGDFSEKEAGVAVVHCVWVRVAWDTVGSFVWSGIARILDLKHDTY